MSKKKLWLFSSFALIAIVLVSSVFTIVYSASDTITKYYTFNFMATAQTTGKIVTTKLDDKTVHNITTMQTMKIAQKFSFNPTGSCQTYNGLFGESLEDVWLAMAVRSDSNLLAIPIRVVNNMCDYTKIKVNFTNIGASKLGEYTYYEVYSYQAKAVVKEGMITDDGCEIYTNLVRGKYVDFVVVVGAIQTNADLTKLDPLVFNLSLEMSRV